MNITEVCRLCLAKSNKTSDEIFFPIDEDFERKFTEITEITLDVYNENFPATVCNTCLTQFEEYYNYRKGLIEKQKRLNLLLGIKKDLTRNHKPEVKRERDEVPNKYKLVVLDDESHSQNNELLEEKETEGEFMETQDIEYQEEESEFVQQDESTIMNYEEILQNEVATEGEEEEEDGDQEEEEYELEEAEIQQHQGEELEVYQEEAEEYVDSGDEYIEEMDQGESDDRILFAIAAESEIDQIEGDCIIVKTDDAMKEHIRKKRKYEKSNSKDRPYRCWQSDCTAAFTHRSSINKHMLLAHNVKCDKTTCMMCGHKFSQYSEFLSHVKKHTRKSECDICKLTFVTDEKMNAHRDRVHKNDSNDRSFKCHLCDAMFKRKEHLNSHITYRHTDQSDARRFPCSDCSSTFLTRQDLKNHQKSHTQLKKTCAYCEYECRDLKSIKLHCQKIHNTTKIYQCGCEETFELFKDYQFHKKNCYRVIDSTTKCDNE